MSTPQGGWLRGVVKYAESGDTIVIVAAGKGGQIPIGCPEKRLTLSSLMAPKFVRVSLKSNLWSMHSRLEFIGLSCLL